MCSSPMRTEEISASSEVNEDQQRVKFFVALVFHLGGVVGSAPTHRAGDPGSNPGPGDNFSLKLKLRTPV